jgi:hypothetical protein
MAFFWLGVAGIKYSYLCFPFATWFILETDTFTSWHLSIQTLFFFYFAEYSWCHAEQNLVKDFSLCHHPSLLLQHLIRECANCLLILASVTCLSGCSLLLLRIALSGRHLRIPLLPRTVANSKWFNSIFKTRTGIIMMDEWFAGTWILKSKLDQPPTVGYSFIYSVRKICIAWL